MLTCLALASFVAWLVLTFARGDFWRPHPATLSPTIGPACWPAVIAIVPARDEAATIGDLIASLRAQDYPGSLSVIVVDDCSSDDTAAVASSAGEAMAGFVLLRGAPRPHGWTGKLWAMQQGVEHAQEHCREGTWLWFTDADIVHGPETLRCLIAKGEGEGLAMVSLMVKLSSQGRAARLLIPAFIYFFQKLFPFAWVNDPKRPIAAAAGGCLLVRRQAFHRAGGLSAIRSRLIDDCAMAAVIKPHGPIWLGLTGSSHSLRLYPHLDDVWAMVVRTAYTQLGNSPRRLAFCLVGMLLVYQIPWIVIVASACAGTLTAAAVLGVAAMLLMLRCYAPTASSYALPAAWALTLPLAAFAYTLMTIDSARRHWLGRGGAWKGRTQDEQTGEAPLPIGAHPQPVQTAMPLPEEG